MTFETLSQPSLREEGESGSGGGEHSGPDEVLELTEQAGIREIGSICRRRLKT